MRQSGLEPESLADNASTLIFKLLSRDVEEAISTVRFSTSEKIAMFVILFAQSFPNLFLFNFVLTSLTFTSITYKKCIVKFL